MPIPVVCIGNVTLGGAGKTPTVIFLVDYLIKNKIKVHVVSRGYGGKFKDTILSLGGSLSPLEVFKLFRGREPKTDSLIRHLGLSTAT